MSKGDDAPVERERRVRLNLEFTVRVRARLERLAATIATTLTDVIVRALDVYEAILTTQAKGGEVVVTYPDGTERRVRFL
jgi:hypothetical protein